ncbi:DnaB helicase C-terminal domain-containing protein [Mongoliitalea daihaiensis]|uniref:DnaB helicase C-terminal domain-containing protein n=1 Tax=Mongoliitalea daihaiensis TaxID=2782006 RepID=UPI001F1BC0A2|nr:DnaB helicase C-terminal domain-containing protein [Mongoliitalea daihaiensis]UJP63965.1 hypothetical protein IPZ59_14195 [Mongoliitalea daihaiensis]
MTEVLEKWNPAERIKNPIKEAELVHALMNDEDEQMDWLNRIDPNIFFNDSNRQIYGIMVDMFLGKRKINYKNVVSEIMRTCDSYQLNTLIAHLGIINSSHPTDSLENIIKDVSDAYRSRVIYHDVLITANNDFHRNRPIGEIIEKISKSVIGIDDSGKSRNSNITVIDAYEDIINPDPEDEGLTTGLHDWDMVFGGIKRDSYITVGAESGTGKTTYLVDLMYRLCTRHKEKIAICFFSMEMSEKRIYKKLLSRHAKVNTLKFDAAGRDKITPQESERLKSAAKDIKDWPIEIVYETMDIHKIKMKARKFVMQNPGKRHIFLVDHIGKIESSGSDMRVNTIKNSQGLKSLCLDHKSTVIVLSQLVKELSGDKYKVTYHRPNESHIMESGAIKADSDILVLLWRPGNRFKSIPFKGIEEWNCANKMIIIVEKNRDGLEKEDIIFDCQMKYNELENEARAV